MARQYWWQTLDGAALERTMRYLEGARRAYPGASIQGLAAVALGQCRHDLTVANYHIYRDDIDATESVTAHVESLGRLAHLMSDTACKGCGSSYNTQYSYMCTYCRAADNYARGRTDRPAIRQVVKKALAMGDGAAQAWLADHLDDLSDAYEIGVHSAALDRVQEVYSLRAYRPCAYFGAQE